MQSKTKRIPLLAMGIRKKDPFACQPPPPPRYGSEKPICMRTQKWHSSAQGAGGGGVVIPPCLRLTHYKQWRIQGGAQGVRTPPPLGHDVGFLTLGPKLDPPFLLVDLRWTPVADPGCVCVTGCPAPLGMWMTSHGQCPRGVCACECPRVGVFFNPLDPPPLSKILDPRPNRPTRIARIWM